MKIAGSSQSIILAADYNGPGGKLPSVFDDALGPAAGRTTSPPVIIVVRPAASAGTARGPSLNSPPVGLPSKPTVRSPAELYARTQQILSRSAVRSVYLDVHA